MADLLSMFDEECTSVILFFPEKLLASMITKNQIVKGEEEISRLMLQWKEKLWMKRDVRLALRTSIWMIAMNIRQNQSMKEVNFLERKNSAMAAMNQSICPTMLEPAIRGEFARYVKKGIPLDSTSFNLNER